VRDLAVELHWAAVAASSSQFRSRDLFPLAAGAIAVATDGDTGLGQLCRLKDGVVICHSPEWLRFEFTQADEVQDIERLITKSFIFLFM
jgi:hypothetical protein